MNKVTLSWEEIRGAVHDMSGIWSPMAVYGIPRGGVVPAAILATIWGVELLDEPRPGCLIVDDIIDSGRTMDRFPMTKFKTAIVSRPSDDRGILKRDGWIIFPWEANETGPEDAVVRLIEYAGCDPNADGLKNTPKRVIKALEEMTVGYSMNPKEILSVDFESNGYDEIVCLSGIKFYSLCEHHMLPFFGEASIAYLPGARLVGLSKLARIVECFARRLQVQERMTTQIADALGTYLRPNGVAVILRGHHLCMGSRGIQKPDAVMTTSVMRGVFREKPEARAEVMRLLQKGD